MSSTEEKAYEIMRELDVNYVLVIFGGLTGYSSDGAYTRFVILHNSVDTRRGFQSGGCGLVGAPVWIDS